MGVKSETQQKVKDTKRKFFGKSKDITEERVLLLCFICFHLKRLKQESSQEYLDKISEEIINVLKDDQTNLKYLNLRDLLLDTLRNFYSVNAITGALDFEYNSSYWIHGFVFRKDIITVLLRSLADAMAMLKLNTFHWYLIDGQSFSMETKTRSELCKYGVYSLRKIYTHKDIAEIVEYARVRGIKKISEFDATAHVCEGWQSKNLIVGFKVSSTSNYSVEPHCELLDATCHGKRYIYNTSRYTYGNECLNTLFGTIQIHKQLDEWKGWERALFYTLMGIFSSASVVTNSLCEKTKEYFNNFMGESID
uniref:beta-N-acetylhexosaminidase n=1 Tax=Glossina palpalis gambiensis TaxID=67801 RepID=A0A1B0BV48_9MUSC